MRVPPAVTEELARASGPGRADRAQATLEAAAQAYRRERFQEAARLLRALVERGPASASVRELYGLALYRLGRWRPALRELEAFEAMTGSVDQHHVLADCHRALGRHGAVARLWDELRREGVGAEILAEGRIVAAGSLADQGRVESAIELLERGPVAVRRPRSHHLRLWYALASLYERAGDLSRARELFARVEAADPDFADVSARYDALR